MFFLLNENPGPRRELDERAVEDLLFLPRQAAPECRVALCGGADEAVVEAPAAPAQREPHAARIAGIGLARNDAALRQPRDHAAHLALVDARGVREVVEGERLARCAEQRDAAPL